MSENRVFTFTDAVICAQKKTQYLQEINVGRCYGSVDVRCPCEDRDPPRQRRRGKKKLHINFDTGWFYCQRCKVGGPSPVSLYMYCADITDSTAAAREMHQVLDGDSDGVKSHPTPPPEDRRPMPTVYDAAPIEVRDHTYKCLFSLLVLSNAHKKMLLERGLTEYQIDKLGYKSLPRDKKARCKDLLQRGCVLEGVPGFFKDKNGEWTMNFYGTGILVPWCNARGQIEFLQIRKDKSPALCRHCDRCDYGKCLLSGKETGKDDTCPSFKEKGMRYYTVSSPDKEGGTAARTWVHGRKGSLTDDWKEVIITEGALKADVASAISGKNFLAVAGVGNIGDLPRALRDLYHAGLEMVYLCYDNEPDNPAVADGEACIKRMLDLIRIPYQKVTWEELNLKGIDDWLKDFKNL